MGRFHDMHILVLHQVNAKKLSNPGTPGLWKFMKWTADAAVLQNVDFSSQFVKWIRDGTALCQTKVATDLPLCWCCCLLVGLLLLFFVVAGWMLGATRGTQLTYSQIRSVWGTICMRRSCKSGSKSEQEELELSSRIQNEERPLAGSHLLLPPHQDLRAPIWKERKRWIFSKF